MTGEELKAIIAERIERDPRLRKIRAKTAKGRYRYFWLYRVLFGIPGTTLKTKGDSVEFQTPSIEGTISRRNKLDGQNKHPWKAEVTEGDAGVSASAVADWFANVYEPDYTTVNNGEG